MNTMKTHALILVTAAIAAVMGLSSCSSLAALQINTPAVQAQIIGDLEKDLLAGGRALLITHGNAGAAVAAISAQEAKNLPGLQRVLMPGKNPVGTAVALSQQ